MLVPLLVKNGFNSAFRVRVAHWSSNSEWESGTSLAVKMGINTIFDQFRNKHARTRSETTILTERLHVSLVPYRFVHQT
jgi:hypothetical protein